MILFKVTEQRDREAYLEHGFGPGTYWSANPAVWRALFESEGIREAPFDTWRLDATGERMRPDRDGDPTEDFILLDPIEPTRLEVAL